MAAAEDAGWGPETVQTEDRWGPPPTCQLLGAAQATTGCIQSTQLPKREELFSEALDFG